MNVVTSSPTVNFLGGEAPGNVNVVTSSPTVNFLGGEAPGDVDLPLVRWGEGWYCRVGNRRRRTALCSVWDDWP